MFKADSLRQLSLLAFASKMLRGSIYNRDHLSGLQKNMATGTVPHHCTPWWVGRVPTGLTIRPEFLEKCLLGRGESSRQESKLGTQSAPSQLCTDRPFSPMSVLSAPASFSVVRQELDRGVPAARRSGEMVFQNPTCSTAQQGLKI